MRYRAISLVCALLAAPGLRSRPRSIAQVLDGKRSRRSTSFEDAPTTIAVGSTFHVPPGDGLPACYAVRLPGSTEYGGALRVGYCDLLGNDPTFGFASQFGAHLSTPAAFDGLPLAVRTAFQEMIDDPPAAEFPCRAAPRIRHPRPLSSLPRSAAAPRIRHSRPLSSLPHSAAVPPFDRLPPFSPCSLLPPTRALADVLDPCHDLPSSPSRDLQAHCREACRLARWGLPDNLPGSCVIFRQLDSAVNRRVRAVFPSAGNDELPSLYRDFTPPATLFQNLIRGVVTPSAGSHLCPTISARRSGHPIRLADRTFFSTRHLLELFGLPFADALASHLLTVHPAVAHRLLGQGVSLHCAVPCVTLLSTLPHSPLRGLRRPWRVVTAFSGADVFCAALRVAGQPYVRHPPHALDSPRAFLCERRPYRRRTPTGFGGRLGA